MKADPSAQHRLADLGDLDSELARMRYLRRSLPEEREIEELAAERRRAAESAARSRISLEDVDRAVRRLDGDVSALRLRLARDAERLATGTVPARDAVEMHHEERSLTRRVEALVTERDEVAERRAAMLADIEHDEATARSLDEEIASATRRRDGARSDADDALAAAERSRTELAGGLPGELLAAYEVRLASGGRGVGRLAGVRCTACGMEMGRGDAAALAAAPADEMVSCPMCSALLVRDTERRAVAS